jgi:PKD repeat protein
VTVTDAAGNTSATTTRTYLLDTTPPAAPGVVGPAGPSNVRTPSFTLSGEAGAAYSCTLVAPDGTSSALTCAAGTLTLSLPGADGTYTLTVTVTDAGGNTSATTTRTYLLDTTPPAAPGVVGPAGPSNDRTPGFTLSGEAGAIYTCTLTGPDGTSTAVACSAGTLTLSLPGDDGTYTLTVTVTDAGGNTSAATTRTYLLDTTPPAAPGVAGPAGPSNVRTPGFALSGEASATYSCTLVAPDGSSSALTCAAGTLTLTLAGADGTYTLVVTVTDPAGNTSATTTRTYLLDTTPPAAPGVVGPAGPSNVRTPGFALSGEAGATYSCTLLAPDGTSSELTCAAGTLTLSLPGADGTYTLVVTVTDAGGNTSATTTRTYLLDTTPPAAPDVVGPAGPSNDRTPGFALSGEGRRDVHVHPDRPGRHVDGRGLLRGDADAVAAGRGRHLHAGRDGHRPGRQHQRRHHPHLPAGHHAAGRAGRDGPGRSVQPAHAQLRADR